MDSSLTEVGVADLEEFLDETLLAPGRKIHLDLVQDHKVEADRLNYSEVCNLLAATWQLDELHRERDILKTRYLSIGDCRLASKGGSYLRQVHPMVRQRYR